MQSQLQEWRFADPVAIDARAHRFRSREAVGCQTRLDQKETETGLRSSIVHSQGYGMMKI